MSKLFPCKRCNQRIRARAIGFFTGIAGTYYNDDIFCMYILNDGGADYHQPMTNLEYLEMKYESRTK